jgi:hypothetical protein
MEVQLTPLLINVSRQSERQDLSKGVQTSGDHLDRVTALVQSFLTGAFMSEIANNIDTAENYDAQQTVEEIEVGDRKAPDVDVDADYEASKQFSVSPIDRTEAGAEAAAAATAPQFDVPAIEEPTLTADATGNPDDYKQMVGDLSSASQGSGNVSDDLVQKALEKGTAGE